MTKQQSADSNTLNCRFARIIQVAVLYNRYCQIGSISQFCGNPIARKSMFGYSMNNQRSFEAMSLFGTIASIRYFMMQRV